MAQEQAPSKDLEVAIAAVRAAGRLTARVQAGLTESQVRNKKDASPVSVGDYAAQAIVRRILTRSLGREFSLVAEESTEALASENADFLREVTDVVRAEWPDAEPSSVLEAVGANPAPGERSSYWTLDPIDGTKGFLRDEHYAIALARVNDGQVTLAVLGCPRLDPGGARVAPSPEGSVLYAEGRGPVCIAPTTSAAPARALGDVLPEPPSPIRVAKSVERAHVNAPRYAKVLTDANVDAVQVAADGQVKYALLALGLADVYLRVPRPGYREKVWDHAAGTFIARCAGHVATDLGGAPLDFGSPPHLASAGGLLVAPPGLHDRLVVKEG